MINLRVSTQVIEHFRFIADAVGVPHNKVRIRGAMIGGGFGGKEDITVEIYLALLAKHTGRPVRLEFSREDSFKGHGDRHPFLMTYRTGVTNDGKITAVAVKFIADAGAYVFLSPYVLLYAAVAAPGPYRVDNLDVDAKAVATNNMYTSAFRGFGAAQACIAYEQQMDEIAAKLGIDGIELRRRNYLQSGEPNSTGFRAPSAIWTEQCVDETWAALGESSAADGPVKIGRGVAAYQQSYGRLTFLHDTSEAWVGVEVDGTVVVRSGVTDIGAGQTSALGQIAAEILGVTLDDVVIYNSDSAVTPLAGTTTATRALYMTGNAVRPGRGHPARPVDRSRGNEFGVEPGEIDMADNEVFAVTEPDKAMPFVELVKLCAADGVHRSELVMFRAPFTDKLDPETGQGQAHPDYAFARTRPKLRSIRRPARSPSSSTSRPTTWAKRSTRSPSRGRSRAASPKARATRSARRWSTATASSPRRRSANTSFPPRWTCPRSKALSSSRGAASARSVPRVSASPP